MGMVSAFAGATLLAGCHAGATSADPAANPALGSAVQTADPAATALSPASTSPARTSAPARKPAAKSSPTHDATPPATAPQEPGCAGEQGTDLGHVQVDSILKKAAAIHIWATVPPPTDVTKPLPTIATPLRLLKAIAFQESGWRTACNSRDGIGFGLFQISASTQDMVNQRFTMTYDRMKPADNAAIASVYLQWLIVYLADDAFRDRYSLSNTKLLDAVIASFNYGQGAIDPHQKIVYPGTSMAYVAAVREEMKPGCKCQSW